MPLTQCRSAEHLQDLNEAPIRPTWFSEHSQALVVLKDIERIHVVSSVKDPSGGRRRRRTTYVVEAYRASSKNRIPTNQKKKKEHPAGELASHQPQHQHQKLESRVERTSGDFADLCGKMYRQAHDAHGAKLCAFCEQVMQELIAGNATPNALTKLLIGEAKVTRRLAKFLNRMLEFTRRCSASKGERKCSGEDMIPLLLHDFLMDRDALSA